MIRGLTVLLMVLGAEATCPSAYSDIGSSLCLSDSPYLNAALSGVTAAQQTEIVDHHNDLRRAVVVQPNNQEPANIPELVWDDAIAAVAQQWAQNQCAMNHDSHSARAIPDYPGVSIGQNAAYRYPKPSWTTTINDWYSEIDDFSYGSSTSGVGHFTQVVSDKATRIGCGRAACDIGGITKYYSYCNYAVGQSSYTTPFTTGTRGSGCRDNESNGLCGGNCAGLLCLNGGAIAYDTCTCACTGLYSGADCSEVTCVADQSYCGGWPEKYCTDFSNVPSLCPHMCGIC